MPYASVSTFLILGIIFTFMREVYLAYKLGMARDLEVFKLAVMIPHMLSQNFAPGFVAVAMPFLVKKSKTTDYLNSLSSVIQFNIITSFTIMLIGCGCSSVLSRVLAPGFSMADQVSLAHSIIISFVYFFVVSLSFSLRSYFLLNETYWPSSLASAIISGSFILSFAILTILKVPLKIEYLLSLSMLVGGFVVLSTHLFAFKKNIINLFKYHWNSLETETWKTLGAMISGAVLFKILNFIPRGIDRVVASMLPDGTVACIEYGFSILNVPGLIFGTSVATIVAPKLAKVNVDINCYDLAKRLIAPVGVAFVLALLVAVFTFFFSETIVSIALKRGAFGYEAVKRTSEILSWQILSLPLLTISIVLAQALLSISNFRILLFAVSTKLFTKLLLVYFLIETFRLKDFGITLFVAELAFILFVIVFIYIYMPVKKIN